MNLTLKDNSTYENSIVENEIVSKLINLNIKNLYDKNIIVFPTIYDNRDLLLRSFVFESTRNNIKTSNLVGKIRLNYQEVNITSRFYNSLTSSDYFLRYLMEKTLNYNVIESEILSDPFGSFYDLLSYLFPFYLNKAMKKGIYKEYVKEEYNDPNLKGKIDFNKHIKHNVPFSGRIYYETRNFKSDNELNQLIRHTIEKLEESIFFNVELDGLTIENITSIKKVTNSYNKHQRDKILNYNILRRFNHPYYTEYNSLQKLCIQILLDQKIGFGTDENNLNGILIDVSWLWEEYLSIVLNGMLVHPDNRLKVGGIDFFTEGRRKIYPDFHSINKKIVIDAKYKRLDSYITEADLYQLTSYLHVMNSQSAGFIFPNAVNDKSSFIGQLDGLGGNIFKLSFNVPQGSNNYTEFKNSILNSEKKLLEDISKLL